MIQLEFTISSKRKRIGVTLLRSVGKVITSVISHCACGYKWICDS